MLELLRELFPFLVALYLIDGINLIDRHHLLFVATVGRRFQPYFGSFFLNYLPLGVVLPTQRVPLCLTSKGIVVPRKTIPDSLLFYQAGAFETTTFDSFSIVTSEGKRVKLDKNTLLKTASSAIAEDLQKTLTLLKQSKPTQRNGHIQHWQRQAFDLETARAQWQGREPLLWFIETLGLTFFTLVFILLPIALFTDFGKWIDLPQLVVMILGNFLVTVAVVCWGFSRLHQTSFGKTLYENISLILSPVTASFASGHLLRDLLASYDFMTISALLLDKESFSHLLRREWIRMDNLDLYQNDPEWLGFWEKRRDLIRHIAAEVGVKIETVLAAPTRKDSTTSKYCPACHEEYLQSVERCSECELRLLDFALAE